MWKITGPNSTSAMDPPAQGFSNCAASALFAADLYVTLFATSHPSE